MSSSMLLHTWIIWAILVSVSTTYYYTVHIHVKHVHTYVCASQSIINILCYIILYILGYINTKEGMDYGQWWGKFARIYIFLIYIRSNSLLQVGNNIKTNT